MIRANIIIPTLDGMEEFWEDYKGTIIRVSEHLEIDFGSLMNKKFDIRHVIPPYATNQTGKKWKWPNLLNEEHKKMFRDLFPDDTLERLGYSDIS